MSEEELGYYGYADFLASAIISIVVFCVCCAWVCPLLDLGPHRPPFATTFLLLEHRQEERCAQISVAASDKAQLVLFSVHIVRDC